MPPRFFTVDEAYNTNRNPVDMGLVHPLQYVNEDSVIGQIGYSPGPIMNTDLHAMTWCHNFEGGKAFTTVLGHNWEYAHDNWFRTMILNAVQWTAGQTYDNCVTYNEVRDMLATAASNGDVTAAANTSLSSLLDTADTAHRAGNDAAAATAMNAFVAQTKNTANVAANAGDLLALQSKGAELVGWMTGNEAAPPAPAFSTTHRRPVGGTVPATLSLTLGAAATSARSPRAWARTTRAPPRPPSSRPPVTRPSRSPIPLHQHRQARQRHVRPAADAAGQGGGAFAPVGGSAARRR